MVVVWFSDLAECGALWWCGLVIWWSVMSCQCGSAVVWLCRSAAVCQCRSRAVWQSGSVAVQCCGYVNM